MVLSGPPPQPLWWAGLWLDICSTGAGVALQWRGRQGCGPRTISGAGFPSVKWLWFLVLRELSVTQSVPSPEWLRMAVSGWSAEPAGRTPVKPDMAEWQQRPQVAEPLGSGWAPPPPAAAGWPQHRGLYSLFCVLLPFPTTAVDGGLASGKGEVGWTIWRAKWEPLSRAPGQQALAPGLGFGNGTSDIWAPSESGKAGGPEPHSLGREPGCASSPGELVDRPRCLYLLCCHSSPRCASCGL